MNLSQYEYLVIGTGHGEKARSVEPTKTEALKAAAQMFHDDDITAITIHKQNAPKDKAV